MKSLRILLMSILFFTLMLSTITCVSSNTSSNTKLGEVTDYRFNTAQQVIKDGPAPNFQIQMPDATLLFLRDMQGEVVLLNFWAVSCPYCILEMPYLQTAYKELSAQGVVILGINVGESEKTVATFLKGKDISFPIILDPDYYASTLYGIRYLPTTYFIDKTGNIQIMKLGAFQNANEIITMLQGLTQ